MPPSTFTASRAALIDPIHYQFVLGFFSGAPATPRNLVFLQSQLGRDATWSAYGIGCRALPILYTTLALGGHVRVGLEDNIYYRKGELCRNVDLVERAARVIREVNNEVATPAEARQILGLPQKGYGGKSQW